MWPCASLNSKERSGAEERDRNLGAQLWGQASRGPKGKIDLEMMTLTFVSLVSSLILLNLHALLMGPRKAE